MQLFSVINVMGLLTVDGKYITIRNSHVNVEQSKNLDMDTGKLNVQPGVYNVLVEYQIYASQNAALNNKRELEKKFVNCITPKDKLSGTNIHRIVYDKLKELYPGSVDL